MKFKIYDEDEPKMYNYEYDQYGKLLPEKERTKGEGQTNETTCVADSTASVVQSATSSTTAASSSTAFEQSVSSPVTVPVSTALEEKIQPTYKGGYWVIRIFKYHFYLIKISLCIVLSL